MEAMILQQAFPSATAGSSLLDLSMSNLARGHSLESNVCSRRLLHDVWLTRAMFGQYCLSYLPHSHVGILKLLTTSASEDYVGTPPNIVSFAGWTLQAGLPLIGIGVPCQATVGTDLVPRVQNVNRKLSVMMLTQFRRQSKFMTTFDCAVFHERHIHYCGIFRSNQAKPLVVIDNTSQPSTNTSCWLSLKMGKKAPHTPVE